MRASCAILPSNWLEKKNGMKNNSGFTLVELIAVIAILAVLLAAAAPRAAGLIQGARHSAAVSDARITAGAVLSADVNLRTGWLEELVYENEDTQVKLTFAEDGTAVVEEITDK